ncbi:MAG: hypothetical protein JW984_15955 [Deltaproteobacteria bacterium]|uniref:Uncharacterized protein n=1 Tax=Candidatus Zymogenus saltonus TaxID=2844893 RepID=A0A9D8KJL3_9DELT|nr:hypothetical protein [Candidatus Zymogenus saltonus]
MGRKVVRGDARPGRRGGKGADGTAARVKDVFDGKVGSVGRGQLFNKEGY